MLVEVNFEEPRWLAPGIGLEALAARAARAVLVHLGHEPGGFEISLLACNDDRIRALNAQFRGHDRPTNVLSWPSVDLSAATDGAAPLAPEAGQVDAPEPLGDIALAYETCAREAAAQGKAMVDHALHLLVHSVLHLLGHDHEREGDAQRMERIEVAILAKLGIANPYSPGAPPPDRADTGCGLDTGQER